MTEWLLARVGISGRVFAVDIEHRFAETIEHPAFEVRRADILEVDVEEGAYDLGFTRLTLQRIAARDAVLEKLARTIHEVVTALADRRASSGRTRCARLDMVSTMPSPLLSACGLNRQAPRRPQLRHFMNSPG